MCLNVFKIPLLAGAIAKDSESDHYEHRDEDYDDPNFHESQQKSNESDQLFQERDYQKNQSNDGAQPAESLKDATAHVFTPLVLLSLLLRSPFEWQGRYVPSRELSSFTGAKSGCVNRSRGRND